jgi:uncharacterized protein (TIGR00251 family)
MPTSETEVKISARVHPNAAANEVVDFSNGILQVKVAAPPVKGKANRELVAFLGQILDIAKSKIRIIKGHYTRNKVIAIDSVSHQEIIRRLSTYSKH